MYKASVKRQQITELLDIACWNR